ncbi:MAG: hypothetical protein AB7F25_13595 [Deferribacterales bacterium]
MELIDIEEIQELMRDDDYLAVCQGDDSVAEEALENARIYVQAVADSYGLEYDESDAVLRLAVKKRTLAELYIYAAEWTTAEQYKTETAQLLAPLAPVTSSTGEIPKQAAAYTQAGRGNWQGYR